MTRRELFKSLLAIPFFGFFRADKPCLYLQMRVSNSGEWGEWGEPIEVSGVSESAFTVQGSFPAKSGGEWVSFGGK